MARVNEGSHSFTCHPHVYPQVEWTLHAFTPQPQSITLLWPVLFFRPAESRRLSSPEWLVTNRGGLPVRRRSPIKHWFYMAVCWVSCTKLFIASLLTFTDRSVSVTDRVVTANRIELNKTIIISRWNIEILKIFFPRWHVCSVCSDSSYMNGL